MEEATVAAAAAGTRVVSPSSRERPLVTPGGAERDGVGLGKLSAKLFMQDEITRGVEASLL